MSVCGSVFDSVCGSVRGLVCGSVCDFVCLVGDADETETEEGSRGKVSGTEQGIWSKSYIVILLYSLFCYLIKKLRKNILYIYIQLGYLGYYVIFLGGKYF